MTLVQCFPTFFGKIILMTCPTSAFLTSPWLSFSGVSKFLHNRLTSSSPISSSSSVPHRPMSPLVKGLLRQLYTENRAKRSLMMK